MQAAVMSQQESKVLLPAASVQQVRPPQMQAKLNHHRLHAAQQASRMTLTQRAYRDLLLFQATESGLLVRLMTACLP